MPKKKGPEALIQAAILDWLAAKHILAFRMNSGAMFGEYKGKRWAVRFGTPGMADILAFDDWEPALPSAHLRLIVPTWIECKALKGMQSEDQKSFENLVKSYGHRYIVAKSIDDVERAI